ncbi:hypothetical protein [uncultured Campylobacter sp.]|jgi:hypothetical protein|uniref:hypothetical protein n=1 Tax=uncultured Campylobacter sp. TaxID=218934 RepID=UPI0026200D2A|nr:hypothetical protein [uncultured Campylobacter sp.]
MRELRFEITFKSPVILQASSNTQGKMSSLDFIPGSAFLGMVASRYSDFSDPFKIFHSGAVKFCDASPIKDGKEFFKIPLSYFHEKLDGSKIYNHHLLSREESEKFTQLKQMRSGYINDEKEKLSLKYEYSQKSAYDKDKRRSKDSQMYGYEAFRAGLKWRFSVKFDASVSEDDIVLAKETLVCSTRLGKSKSAEYGAVEIKFIGENTDKIQTFTPPEKYTFVYAKSRLALIDENGNPSYDVKYILPNLDANNVDYEKTQIRISNFTPYNGARATKDYERACINKGSVIALKNLSAEQISALKNGVGAYLSEGFGEVLINPWFLDGGDAENNPIEFQKEAQTERSIGKIPIQSDLAKFLKQKQTTKDQALEIAERVADFIKSHKDKFSKISKSQWGAMRSICREVAVSDKVIGEKDVNGEMQIEEIKNESVAEKNENIAAQISKFMLNGVRSANWDCEKRNDENVLVKGGCGDTLVKAVEGDPCPLKFDLLLSMQMPKITGEKQ